MTFNSKNHSAFSQSRFLSNLVFDGMLIPPGFRVNISNTYKGYRVNKFGYRCDEFIKIHEGKHIIFSGCSTTYGEGIPNLEDVWAKKIYNEYSKSNKVSGYYNLAISGTGIQSQVTNLFRYFSRYGNPNLIFFCISEFNRGYISKTDKDCLYDGFYLDDETLKIMEQINYEYYFMLEQYCKTNNIRLISWTWDFIEKDNEIKIKTTQDLFSSFKFSTFYRIDRAKFTKNALDYAEKNSEKKFLLLGSDRKHLGIAYQDAYAKTLLESCSI